MNDLRRQLDQSRPTDTGSRLAAQWRNDEFTYGMLARKAGVNIPLDRSLLTDRPTEPERYPVAKFEAKDLSGKTWSLADLQGKVTYVSVWRVGCGGECRAALQGVQRLYERWKNRTDRAVLTISVDENPAIAESFIKENEYTVPVIYGAEIAEKFIPGGGWPQEWLIDPQGRRLQRHVPRASDETISKIEEMADKISVIQ